MLYLFGFVINDKYLINHKKKKKKQEMFSWVTSIGDVCENLVMNSIQVPLFLSPLFPLCPLPQPPSPLQKQSEKKNEKKETEEEGGESKEREELIALMKVREWLLF